MRTWVLAAVAAGAAVAGCNPPAEPAAEVKVADATFATLDAAIKAHTGDVVLVDFWATWCGPCRQRFPHLVAMHNRYAGRGLRCVSVSIDKPDDAAAVRQFLRDERATFENFHWKDYRTELNEFREHFNFDGGIPHMVAYDRSGKRAWDSGTDFLSPPAVDDLVRGLLDAQ